MTDRLEQFIRENREAFDSEEPARKLWDQSKPLPQKKQGGAPKSIVIKISLIRKTAVAAALILLVGAAWWLIGKKPAQQNGAIAATGLQKPKSNPATENPQTDNRLVMVQPADSQQAASARPEARPLQVSPSLRQNEEADNDQELMMHYASIVEIKRKELKRIEKEEPVLYNQFAADVHKLDSVYRSLAKKLPENPNHEKLLEAMIQNLQLQMDLLNRQLGIIKQINHSKKTAYEKAYKSA